jgi:hypothetical protein
MIDDDGKEKVVRSEAPGGVKKVRRKHVDVGHRLDL